MLNVERVAELSAVEAVRQRRELKDGTPREMNC